MSCSPGCAKNGSATGADITGEETSLDMAISCFFSFLTSVKDEVGSDVLLLDRLPITIDLPEGLSLLVPDGGIAGLEMSNFRLLVGLPEPECCRPRLSCSCGEATSSGSVRAGDTALSLIFAAHCSLNGLISNFLVPIAIIFFRAPVPAGLRGVSFVFNDYFPISSESVRVIGLLLFCFFA